MKLIIPPEIPIGARIFHIRFNDKVLGIKEWKGELVDKEDLIRLAHRSNLSMFETLIHEIKHEISYLTSDEGNPGDEGRNSAETNFLCQSLLSMDVEPDFSQIPEEEN